MANSIHQNPGAFEGERAELRLVLASRLFSRASVLSRVLVYICEKFFQGEAESIKEYSIAVEALGRPQSFDPGIDTIVRVEASRLRRRLREYYETEGADHRINILLSEVGYLPRFIHKPESRGWQPDRQAWFPNLAPFSATEPAPQRGCPGNTRALAVALGRTIPSGRAVRAGSGSHAACGPQVGRAGSQAWTDGTGRRSGCFGRRDCVSWPDFRGPWSSTAWVGPGTATAIMLAGQRSHALSPDIPYALAGSLPYQPAAATFTTTFH